MKIFKKLKNKNINLFILILIIFFLTSFFIYFYFKKTKLNKIKYLTTKVQLSYLKKYLGEPVFVDYSKDKKQKEYIFINKDFYTQVITNDNDKVLAFFITSRKKDFNPQIKNQVFNIELGKSTLQDIYDKNSLQKCSGFLGNTARSYYFEEYYFGRSGYYQRYVFGYNDAGFNEKNKNDLSFLIGKKEEDNLCEEIKNSQRENIIINTYGMISSEVEKLDFEYGVDKNVVSLVND